ncbi:MAG: YraN family protein [Casimicrobium sp.]
MTTGDGEHHEREAEAFLKASGLVLVARNWRCRLGEIDLIMKEGATLVFVEVRKRQGQSFGGAIASIGAQKQAKLQRAIGLYLSNLPNTPACRVDAVLFDGKRAPVWEQNIFGA